MLAVYLVNPPYAYPMEQQQARLDVAAEVLHALGRPAVILNEVNLMVRATEEATAIGLQQERPQ